jgi:hypothetical protein
MRQLTSEPAPKHLQQRVLQLASQPNAITPAHAAGSGLGTSNKKNAAALALKLYLDVRANGWEVVMRQRRGDPATKKVNVTIGEYIEAVAAKSLFSPKTLKSYAQALRKITGDIAGVVAREKRDAIKLRTLTPEKIEGWRIEFIRKKATDPLREKSARVSVGSFILRARRSLALRQLRGFVTL